MTGWGVLGWIGIGSVGLVIAACAVGIAIAIIRAAAKS